MAGQSRRWQASAGLGEASRVESWHGTASQACKQKPLTSDGPTTSRAAFNQPIRKVTPVATEPKEPEAQVQIDKIAAETIRVPILGTTPLIVHRFSEKAKRQMLDAMQGRKSPKESKNPEAEYDAAFYRTKDDRYGFPVVAFKQATVGAARFYPRNSVTMTALKQFLFIRGEIGVDGQGLAIIEGEPHMREDVVRVGRGGTDLRYRPEFSEWSTALEVTYVTSALTRSSVLSLIDAGGMGVGVGEWRPERDGDFGTYRIDPTRQVEVIA